MDVDSIIAGLSEAQKRAVKDWRFKGWVKIRSDIQPAVETGLVDVWRFNVKDGTERKARLNKYGLAVRSRLEVNNG